MEKIQLEKIINRTPKKYSISKVFFNTKLETQTHEYLKDQNYLNYKEINKILKIKFDETYPFGYILKNENEIVGFLGTMFSQRIINKKKYEYCNLHTWIVNKSDRLNSYLLLLPLIEKNCFMMAFTAIKSLVGLFQKFDFKTLQMKYRVIFLINFSNFFKKNLLKVENRNDQIKKGLTDEEWKIYQDHSDSSFIKFIISEERDSSNSSLIICTKVKKKFFKVLNIFYVSNKTFVKKNWQSISDKMSEEFKVYFCGQYFLDEEDCAIPNDIGISKNFNRDICVKNFPSDMNFNIL